MKLLSVGFQAVLTVVLFLDRTDRFFKSQITKVYYVWTQLTLVLLLLLFLSPVNRNKDFVLWPNKNNKISHHFKLLGRVSLAVMCVPNAPNDTR